MGNASHSSRNTRAGWCMGPANVQHYMHSQETPHAYTKLQQVCCPPTHDALSIPVFLTLVSFQYHLLPLHLWLGAQRLAYYHGRVQVVPAV